MSSIEKRRQAAIALKILGVLILWSIASITLFQKNIKSFVPSSHGASQPQHESPAAKKRRAVDWRDRIIQAQPDNNSSLSIRLLGERHSGTTYTTKLLKECFPTVNVGDFLLANKHWHQPSPEYIQELVAKYGADEVMRRSLPQNDRNLHQVLVDWPTAAESPHSAFKQTVVIVMVRDPYDWIEGMRQIPHHWPLHLTWRQKTANELQKEQQDRANKQQKLLSKKMKASPILQKGRKLTMRDENRLQQQYAKMRQNDGTNQHGREDLHPAQQAQRRRLEGEQRPRHSPARRPLSQVRSERKIPFRFKGVPLDWRTFVATPLELPDTSSQQDRLCQKGYAFGTIQPCASLQGRYIPPLLQKEGIHQVSNFLAEANDPVVELQSDGRPYPHPLALRAAKLENHLNLSRHWDFRDFIVIRYEDFMIKGPNHLLNKVSKALGGVKPQCEPKNSKGGSFRHKEIDSDFLQWIKKHLDWEIEKRAGYKPR